MPVYFEFSSQGVSQEHVQHRLQEAPDQFLLIHSTCSLAGLFVYFYTCLKSSSCCSACLSRSLCSTSSCSSWGSGGSCLMVTPAGRAPPSWCSRSSSSVSSGWLWCWRPTGLSLGFVIIWGKNKAPKTKTEPWWCSNVKFISQWNSRMWQIPSDMRASLQSESKSSFHWRILLLTSLIWITRPDWCLAHFKPFQSNWMWLDAPSTVLGMDEGGEKCRQAFHTPRWAAFDALVLGPEPSFLFHWH